MPELPIGAIDGQDETITWFGNALDDEARHRRQREGKLQKEILEASVATLRGAIFSVLSSGEDREIDGSMTQNGLN